MEDLRAAKHQSENATRVESENTAPPVIAPPVITNNADQIAKTRVLRSNARKALRAEGKPIPSILKKGSLKGMLESKKAGLNPRIASPEAVELGESNGFDQADLDKDQTNLKKDLAKIETRTDTSHIKHAKRLPSVSDDEGEIAAASMKMARKDSMQQAALKKYAKGTLSEAQATEAAIESAKAAVLKSIDSTRRNMSARKAQLISIRQAADSSAKTNRVHASHIARGHARVSRQYKDLMHERNTMPDYTVTDNVHHPGHGEELGESLEEQQDGETLESMKSALAQTKVEAAKEVQQAQKNAMLAVNKVKDQVNMLKKKMKASKESAQKKQDAAVRHVAGKAMLAVNAAKLASALSPAVRDPVKEKLVAVVAADKAAAAKATNKWKLDAGRLARLENTHLMKAKAKVKSVEKSGLHAQHNLKVATQVTETFKEIPAAVPVGL